MMQVSHHPRAFIDRLHGHAPAATAPNCHTQYIYIYQTITDHQLKGLPVQIVTNSQVNETYVLYQCGLAAPNNAALPPGSKVFSIPLTSVAIGDTVPLAFIVSSRLDLQIM